MPDEMDDTPAHLRVIAQVVEKTGAFRRKFFSPLLIGLLCVYPVLLVARELNLFTFDTSGALDRGLTTALVVFCAERLIALERMARRRRTYAFEDEAAGFEALVDAVQHRSVKRVDAIQLSGQIALPAITRLMKAHPAATFRILLLHDDFSRHFDQNQREDWETASTIADYHAQRVRATLKSLLLVAKEKQVPAERLQFRYYKLPPSLCAILIDDTQVGISWYRSRYAEGGGMTVTSHDSPAFVPGERDSAVLARWLGDHFANLWVHAVNTPARPKAKARTAT